jgi:hypothetical protein
MTLYEFDKFRVDKDIYNYLTTASIYVIVRELFMERIGLLYICHSGFSLVYQHP